MRMHRCDVIEAYVVLILLDRANEPLYTKNIREELEKNFIGNSKLPNTRTLAAIFRRSDYFISINQPNFLRHFYTFPKHLNPALGHASL